MSMVTLDTIEWGPTDANEPDPLFSDKFVEPQPIQEVLKPKYWLISGEKGSGKSAIRQFYLNNLKTSFTGIVDLKFDSLEFNAVVNNLSTIASVTNLDRLNLMTHYWQYCLVLEMMKDFVQRRKHSTDRGTRTLANFLTKKRLKKAGVLQNMLDAIAHCWTYLDELTQSEVDRSSRRDEFLPDNLTPETVMKIHDYPWIDSEFSRKRIVFANLLKNCNEKYLIILDGFDKLENTTKIRDSVNLIFQSLAEAVQQLRIDEHIAPYLQIKCLIPNDRYLSIRSRESDKIDSLHKTIRWDRDGLKGFMSKRMRLHPKLKHLQSFRDLWLELMPERIANPYYGVEEDSFDYILRHTLYRPRHLQMHMEKIASLCGSRPIEARRIPKAIHDTGIKIANSFINEYAIDHPNLKGFLAFFRRKPNIMPFKYFRHTVERALHQFNIEDVSVSDKIDLLYTMGLFGVIEPLDEKHERVLIVDRYLPPRKAGIQPYRVDFYFTNPRINMSNELADDQLIAIHPVFVDLEDMSPHAEMIVG
jgi:hypothetical protein